MDHHELENGTFLSLDFKKLAKVVACGEDLIPAVAQDAESGEVGTGMVGAPACGDVMRLQIKVGEDGVIEDAKFKTYGCGSAIASSSLLTEWVKGRSLDEAEGIKNTEIAEELALPPVKIHCSVLAEDAIKAAIQDYRSKHSGDEESSVAAAG